MFYALAIVCDVYFVPSLEKVSEVRLGDKVNKTFTVINSIFCLPGRF